MRKTFSRIAALMAPAAMVAFAYPVLAQSLPDGKGKEMVQMICTGCHDLSPITGSIGFSRADWNTVVESMIDMGATIKPDEAALIVTYLAENFPPKK